MDIGVIDYGAGNLHNICRLLTSLNHTLTIIKSPISTRLDALILPGVGSFKYAVDALADQGLDSFIHDFAKTGSPFVSICVGMQLLADYGFEGGGSKGLGLISGKVERIPCESGYRLPNIGWSDVTFTGSRAIESAYFAHSYYFNSTDKSNIVAHTCFGSLMLPAIIRRENIIGIQFHPEISGRFGGDYLSSILC